MARLNRFAAASALAAAFSLAATPAMAHGHYHHHRWHRDRIDGGDILAGAAIIGVIAAIASANKREREARAPAPPPDDRQGYAYDDGATDGTRDSDYDGPAPQAPDDDPAVDNRPEWHGDDAQPQPEPQDDGRYSTSDAPDFGDDT